MPRGRGEMFVVELSSHVINACPTAEIVRGVWTSNSGEHRNIDSRSCARSPLYEICLVFLRINILCAAHTFVFNINKVHSADDNSHGNCHLPTTRSRGMSSSSSSSASRGGYRGDYCKNFGSLHLSSNPDHFLRNTRQVVVREEIR